MQKTWQLFISTFIDKYRVVTGTYSFEFEISSLYQ